MEFGTCELCGSARGIIEDPVPVPEFGTIGEIARAKVPHTCKCICENCKGILKAYEAKKKDMIDLRRIEWDKEDERRKKKGLCYACGGELIRSGPFLVYEGTYETILKCDHCGIERKFT